MTLVEDYESIHQFPLTGKAEVDREITALKKKVREAEKVIDEATRSAEILWSRHAPWYVDSERVRGGNSGGWE